MTQYFLKNAIILGCLVDFEGMKAVSRPYAKDSLEGFHSLPNDFAAYKLK